MKRGGGRPPNRQRPATTAATWLTAHRTKMDAIRKRGDRAMASWRQFRDDGSCQRCGGMDWHAVGCLNPPGWPLYGGVENRGAPRRKTPRPHPPLPPPPPPPGTPPPPAPPP